METFGMTGRLSTRPELVAEIDAVAQYTFANCDACFLFLLL